MLDSLYLIHLSVWLTVNEMQGNIISDTAHVMSALSCATGGAETAVSEHQTRSDFHYCMENIFFLLVILSNIFSITVFSRIICAPAYFAHPNF
jgi:hypothetical protein